MSAVAYFTHRCLCAGGGSKKLVHFFRGLIDPLGGVAIEGEPDFDGDPLDSEATVELGSETPKKKSVLPSKIEDSQSSSRPTVR